MVITSVDIIYIITAALNIYIFFKFNFIVL